MGRSLLVYNPAAGQWWRRPAPERVLDALARRGVEAELRITRGQDEATEIVREHLGAGLDTVWVCGGDGTVAQAATALVGTGIPIGILPIGTVNVLALECGVPSDPFRAVRALTGPTARRRFRAWMVGPRAVLLGVGVGFEARAIGRVDRTLKDWLGIAAVGARGVYEWARYEFPALRITGEDARGRPFEHSATQVLVTNPRRYAGHHTTAPSADPHDAVLEAVLFRGASRLRMAGLWAGVELPGALHLRVPGVTVQGARRLSIRSEDGRLVEAHVNGDAVEATPLRVEPSGMVVFSAPRR